jgi:excisionase family DNA binding protein
MSLRIITVTPEDLEELVTRVVRTEMEQLYQNPFIGVTFEDELWTRKQAANFLGIGEQTIVKLVLEKRLVAQRSGRKYHFLKSSIMNYLKDRN